MAREDDDSKLMTGLLALSKRFDKTCQRVLGLHRYVAAALQARSGTDADISLSEAEEDIVRASIVLLHAAFDDYLRSLAKLCFHRYPREVLDGIPLLGCRNQKFTLGQLLEMADKRVSDLLKESLEAAWDKRTFNKREDLIDLCKQVGIDWKPFEPYLPELDRMMKWRHRIVHQADYEGPTGVERFHMSKDDVFSIIRWTSLMVVVECLFAAWLAPDALKAGLQQRAQEAERDFRIRYMEITK